MQTLAKRHPRFWRIQGNEPSNCELIVDESVTYDGKRSCLLKHIGTGTSDYGGMVQTMGAFDYRGKRISFSAKVKLDSNEGKANLFVTLLDSQPAVIVNNQMVGQEISRTTGWTALRIVTDVPTEARYINFGAMLRNGAGNLWIADLAISAVSENTPLTENSDNRGWVRKEPTNFGLGDTEYDTEKPVAWRFHASPRSASDKFKSGLKQEDDRSALWITSDADLVPEQGEKSNLDGTFTQTFDGVPWRGKRVRFSADVKCRNVGDWCGLMMWVQGAGPKTLAFTTMYNSPLSGSIDWKQASVVLDVPQIANRIIVAATLNGNGEALFSNLSFSEAAPDDVPTDRESSPKNLNFID